MVDIDMTLKAAKTITKETEHLMKETYPEGNQQDLSNQIMHDLETTARVTRLVGKGAVSEWGKSDHGKPKEVQEEITL